jgi:ADP-sugar diphosphatase
MSLTIDFRGKQVSVTVAPPPDLDEPLSHPLMSAWLTSLDASMDLQALELQSVDRFSSGAIGFIKFKSTTLRNGVAIPGIVVLRGGAVAVLAEITDTDTGDVWTVLTRQPRVATGRIQLEIPAGMADGSGNLRGVAITELREECGLVVEPEELLDLTQLAYGDGPGVYTACGLFDETMRIYLWRKRLPHEKVAELEGRIGGVDAHEQITLCLVRFDDLWRMTSDGKALSALALRKALKDEGRLPE